MTIEQPVAVGVVGCGTISRIYLENCTASPLLRVVACADLDVARAEERAAEFGVPRASTPEALLADPEVSLVLNLTIPDAHAPVALAALEAGKHVYNEKPLAVSRADGRRMLDLAAARGLRVGGAPDTFLGAGLQTGLRLLDEGAIGAPVAATAMMLSPGHEGWHPSPDFYYKRGGGPLFDMGPYYLTALVALLGPVARVSAVTRTTHPTRTIRSQPRAGETIDVEVPTHHTAILEFAAGAVATLITSFDVSGGYPAHLEIYGATGHLRLPDPNTFGGPLKLRRQGEREWSEVELDQGASANSRGLGVADMAAAIAKGQPHRASGELAFHVLDVMHAVEEAAAAGASLVVASTCERPAPLGSQNS
jgi:predicted dehydrogenase